jgi:competence protein ComEA
MIGLILRYRVQVAGLLLVGILLGVAAMFWGSGLAGAPPGAQEVVLPNATVAPDGPVRLAGAAATVLFTPVPPPPLPATLKVYVVGAVAHPGVYPLIEGDRIEDAVRAAGGALADADLDSINLSARVHDEEQIRVPHRGDTSFTPAPLAPPVPPTAPAGPPAAGAPAAPAPASVNINTADATARATLPGIGPTLAGRIIAYRTAHGPFARIADIQRVSGIGPATFEKISAYITVGP